MMRFNEWRIQFPCRMADATPRPKLGVQNFRGFFTELGSPRARVGGEKPRGFITSGAFEVGVGLPSSRESAQPLRPEQLGGDGLPSRPLYDEERHVVPLRGVAAASEQAFQAGEHAAGGVAAVSLNHGGDRRFADA